MAALKKVLSFVGVATLLSDAGNLRAAALPADLPTDIREILTDEPTAVVATATPSFETLYTALSTPYGKLWPHMGDEKDAKTSEDKWNAAGYPPVHMPEGPFWHGGPDIPGQPHSSPTSGLAGPGHPVAHTPELPFWHFGPGLPGQPQSPPPSSLVDAGHLPTVMPEFPFWHGGSVEPGQPQSSPPSSLVGDGHPPTLMPEGPFWRGGPDVPSQPQSSEPSSLVGAGYPPTLMPEFTFWRGGPDVPGTPKSSPTSIPVGAGQPSPHAPIWNKPHPIEAAERAAHPALTIPNGTWNATQSGSFSTGGSPTPVGDKVCSTNGTLFCNSLTQFAVCNFGTAVWQPVAAGTECRNGSIVASTASSASCGSNGTLLCNGNDQFGLCNHGSVVYQAVAAGTWCEDGKIITAYSANSANSGPTAVPNAGPTAAPAASSQSLMRNSTTNPPSRLQLPAADSSNIHRRDYGPWNTKTPPTCHETLACIARPDALAALQTFADENTWRAVPGPAAFTGNTSTFHFADSRNYLTLSYNWTGSCACAAAPPHATAPCARFGLPVDLFDPTSPTDVYLTLRSVMDDCDPASACKSGGFWTDAGGCVVYEFRVFGSAGL